MGVDEQARERAILDVTAQLLLRHGYNKVTMSDVADAVGLNRRLVYLLFPSKDALIKALLFRELNLYAKVWNRYLESDPLGGTLASVYRGLLVVLKQFPLMTAMYTRDSAGVNLEAGKALMRRKIAEAQAQVTEADEAERKNQGKTTGI